jgi:tetratricopeptide (TPR) repeat protein
VLIRQDLGLPAARPPGTRDLPVAELLTTDPAAFRALVEGQMASAREDWDGAERAFVRATELDPGFALAHYSVYLGRIFRGNAQDAIPALNAAMQNIYRLSERVQFLVKIENFFIKQEMEKAYAVARMMVELYPDDAAGHQLSAQLEQYRGDRPAAIASLRRILELDPQRHEMLLQIGALQEETGAFADALATYQSYAQSFPEDADVLRRIAGVTQVLGRFDDARAALERALIVDPSSVQAMASLASLERGTGNVDAAWQHLQAALAEAQTPEEQRTAHSALAGYYQSRGQLRPAVEATERALAALAEFQPPVIVLRERMAALGMYARAGMLAQARATLEDAKTQYTAPLHDFWHLGQLVLALELRDSAEISEAAVGVRRILEGFNMGTLHYVLAEADAVQHEIRGDWNAALQTHQRRLELEPKTIATNRDIARALRNLGRPADALRTVELHLRTSPYNVESGIEAARNTLVLGDTTATRHHLDRVSLVLNGADASYRPLIELRTLLAEIET